MKEWGCFFARKRSKIERDKEVAELRKKYCYDPNTTLEVYPANFGPRFELKITQEYLPNNKKKVLEQMGYQYKGYQFIKSEKTSSI